MMKGSFILQKYDTHIYKTSDRFHYAFVSLLYITIHFFKNGHFPLLMKFFTAEVMLFFNNKNQGMNTYQPKVQTNVHDAYLQSRGGVSHYMYWSGLQVNTSMQAT